jgi:OOP family OmpA-OmpF porin
MPGLTQKTLFRKLLLTLLLLTLLGPAKSFAAAPTPAQTPPPPTGGRDVFAVPAEPAPREVTGPDRGKYQLLIDSRTIAGSLLDRKGLIDLNIEFASGSARLKKSAWRQIEEIARALKSKELVDRKILITGHPDAVGSAASNLKLSRRRAEAVKQALVKLGIAPARLTTRGLGESQPIADNRTAAGRARNRRVTLSLVAESGIQ